MEQVTHCAAQSLISPEEAIAQFGVKRGTGVEEIERIKRWMEYKLNVEQKWQTGEKEMRFQKSPPT